VVKAFNFLSGMATQKVKFSQSGERIMWSIPGLFLVWYLEMSIQ
jgi:hypothetical protein